MAEPYVGRFAPSPTGPLHLGSLIAAVASHVDARANAGRWLVRIEDIDFPRSRPGAVDSILRTLEAHRLTWDCTPVRQSQRLDFYRLALERLTQRGLVFYCTCSRRQLSGDHIYPGHCRAVVTPPAQPHAVRLRVPDAHQSFTDTVQGHVGQELAADVGDFVIRRRDELFAYQLVVAVDDGLQRVTHVVRGADLLKSTPRQILLMSLLGYASPSYAHVPVIVDHAGAKLSKQTRATAVDDRFATANLLTALELLGQNPPGSMLRERPEDLLRWAIDHWQPSRIPRQQAITGFVSI